MFSFFKYCMFIGKIEEHKKQHFIFNISEQSFTKFDQISKFASNDLPLYILCHKSICTSLAKFCLLSPT